MEKLTHIVIPVIVFFTCAIFVFQYLWRYIYNYRISERGIEILLFGIMPLMCMHFKDIVEIKIVPLSQIWPWVSIRMFFTLRYGNRFWGQAVLVRRQHGIFRAVIITPDDAENFVEKVKAICIRK